MTKELPSDERLHELFICKPNKGQLIRKITAGKYKAGEIAGHVHAASGYINVTIDRKSYKAHRIIYQMAKGGLKSTDVIDHIDRNPSNNCIKNLRVGDLADNQHNSSSNGFHFHKASGKYQVLIRVWKQSFHIGLYDNEHDAEIVVEAVRTLRKHVVKFWKSIGLSIDVVNES